MKYRADIDGLRSLAVVPVVLNHADIPGFPGGFIGVDVFFVISGFLITRIIVGEIEKGQFSIIDFYERRARRILPALFAVLATCSIAGLFVFSPNAFVDYAKSQFATVFFMSNFEFWRTSSDYFGPGVDLSPLLHTWSLSVEEQFYLFFPLLLILFAKFGSRSWVVLVIVLSALSFIASIWMTSRFPVANFYLSPFRAWELGVGALLAFGLGQSTERRLFPEIIGWLGIFLILASIALIDEHTHFPGLAALPTVLGAALIILSGSQRTTQVSKLLALRPLVWTGLISYSLYLWHWPVLVFARIISETREISILTGAACVILSFFLAWISWRFIEQPFRSKKSDQKISTARIFGLSGTAMLFLAGVSMVIILNGGMLGQHSQERLALYDQAKVRSDLEKICMPLTADDSPCKLGADIAPVTAAVFGDSHAGAMLVGFDSYFKSHNISAIAFVKIACAPMLGVFRADLNRTHKCDENNDRVISKMREFPNLETVFLSARWALAVEGSRAKGEAGGPAILARTGSSNADIIKNSSIAKEGLERMILALQNLGLQIVIVAGIPEMPFDVPEAALNKPIPAGKLPTMQSVVERNHRADFILESIAEKYAVTIVRPVDLLCDQVCIAENESFLLYRDDDHLSQYGANWLVPQLMDQLKPH